MGFSFGSKYPLEEDTTIRISSISSGSHLYFHDIETIINFTIVIYQTMETIIHLFFLSLICLQITVFLVIVANHLCVCKHKRRISESLMYFNVNYKTETQTDITDV